MRRLRIGPGEDGYEIAIGAGGLGEAGRHLAPFLKNGRAIVVSDENVARHWLGPLARALDGAGFRTEPIILPPGEASKSWRQLENLVEDLLEAGLERDEHILALGGGMIGDIAGFAAAIAKRGSGIVQIPTSLLAQVDSAVGGKTAINARAGKNLVGAFHQPGFVLVDPDVLATLPERELRAGYAEIVKYGLIGDAGFFAWCEENAARLLTRDEEALVHAIATCLSAKAKIVSEDESDRAGRRLLNLGHTFAHALEAEAGYSDALLHGEAVAIGIALAFRYSARLDLCSEADADRVAAHLESTGLPTALPQYSDTALIAHMRRDKKVSGGVLTLILAHGIGRAFVAADVEAAELEAFLADQLSGIGRE